MKNLSVSLKIILMVLVVSIVFACNKNETDVNYTIEGNWRVISFNDYENSTTITKTEDNTWSQFNQGDNTVSFTTTDLTSGIVSGRNVTNTFNSDYSIDHQGGITLSDGIWTKINEPEWGRLFHSIIDAESYVIRNNHLIIFYNQKKNSIIFEKVDE